MNNKRDARVTDFMNLTRFPHDLFNLVPASNFIPARVRQILILIFNLTFKKVLFGAAIKIAANYCINFLAGSCHGDVRDFIGQIFTLS